MKNIEIKEYDLRGWIYADIIDEANSYEEIRDQIKYLKYVLHEWNVNRPRLDPNGTLVPEFGVRIEMEIGRREELEKEIENKKTLWTGKKSEFGRFIYDEYYANQDKYTSLRDAALVIYNQHKFKWKDWTFEQCYDLVKKS